MSADAITARLAAGQNGILTNELLRNSGLSQKEIHLRRSAGVLVDVHVGVYRHLAVAPTWTTTVAAAVAAAGTGAVASHRTAARLHGLDGVRAGRIEVTVPDTDLPIRRGVLVHRTTRLGVQDVTTVRAIPLTTIPRTLLDLGAVSSFETVEHAAQDAVIRKLVSIGDLVAVLERVGGRGRRWTASLRAALYSTVDLKKLQSQLEHKLARALKAAGAEGVRRQHELRCGDGRDVVLDFALPEHRLAIEADGHRWHATRARLARDLARSRSIQSSGWTHLRFGWDDLVTNAAGTHLELCRLVSPLGTRVDKERGG